MYWARVFGCSVYFDDRTDCVCRIVLENALFIVEVDVQWHRDIIMVLYNKNIVYTPFTPVFEGMYLTQSL